METILLVMLVAFLTSILSGIFGMGGGMVLMGVLAVTLDPVAAIVCHGVIQFVANGWRSYGLRSAIVKKPVVPFLVGSAIMMGLMAALGLQAEKGILLILLGSTPFLGLALERVWTLDGMNNRHSFGVGFVTTFFQILAGASGPLLDQLFQHVQMTKEQIVATKAIIQTIGHVMKVAYYYAFISVTVPVEPLWIGLLAIPATLYGTTIGSNIMKKMSDKGFRTGSRALIFLIGSVLIWRGALAL